MNQGTSNTENLCQRAFLDPSLLSKTLETDEETVSF